MSEERKIKWDKNKHGQRCWKVDDVTYTVTGSAPNFCVFATRDGQKVPIASTEYPLPTTIGACKEWILARVDADTGSVVDKLLHRVRFNR